MLGAAAPHVDNNGECFAGVICWFGEFQIEGENTRISMQLFFVDDTILLT